MTPSLKKISIFGLAAGVANMLIDQSDDAKVKWRAQALEQASQQALDSCRVRVDKSKLNQATIKIDQICKDKNAFDTVDMLSFILIGLDDLQAYCKNLVLLGRINVMIKRTNWLIQYFDPKLESISIFEDVHRRYRTWAA